MLYLCAPIHVTVERYVLLCIHVDENRNYDRQTDEESLKPQNVKIQIYTFIHTSLAHVRKYVEEVDSVASHVSHDVTHLGKGVLTYGTYA